ncbi:putative transcriptional regulator [Candidatus Propionivibrio aalborgensis]|uniref:Putative transcriptional regulator n=1 Tax=Candidatus Propionivibrio aalborgensis TaxID=1860101 RepID=A0A1A8Y0V2_9RHOO|nr:ATP-binding protein [Candidatus Propionivibrio aalborgensis]MBK7326913.1 putative DNA binding domain-containing protein [Propionivibrio sp.]SBT10769.1 putative transcriptional regulator [Candidatus Propionivibrio aalborgensis]
MSEARDIALVDELRALPEETSWVEFKNNNTDPDVIGKRCSALSNSARIEGRDCAYVLWGINDSSHDIVGTDFNPDAKKANGQVLQLWLANCLQPSIAFSFRVVNHPQGRVVLLEIPAATGTPVAFNSISFIRIGSATPKLTDFPERYQQLIERMQPYRWEQLIARQYATGDDVLALLDYSQYFRLTKQPLPDNRAGIFDRLEADRLIVRDVGERWNITNLGAILFATRLSDFEASLARKGVRFVAYGGNNRAAAVTYRHDGQKGYAAGFEGLVGYLNDLLPKNEHIGAALREAHPLFPELAIRELVANALIHQDMTVTGAGPQIELFNDRIEITNPGRSLVKLDRMIDLPPRSRNEALASLMRRMGMCEEQGSGLDKVFTAVEVFQLPPPLLRADENSMQVVLYAPRSFAEMTQDERVRACYFHAVLKFLSGDKMKNASLCARLGIDPKNAAQATGVINKALNAGLIRIADPDHPRAGYVPHWA